MHEFGVTHKRPQGLLPLENLPTDSFTISATVFIRRWMGASPRCRIPMSHLPCRASSLSCRSGRVAGLLGYARSKPPQLGKSHSSRCQALNTWMVFLLKSIRFYLFSRQIRFNFFSIRVVIG